MVSVTASERSVTGVKPYYTGLRQGAVSQKCPSRRQSGQSRGQALLYSFWSRDGPSRRQTGQSRGGQTAVYHTSFSPHLRESEDVTRDYEVENEHQDEPPVPASSSATETKRDKTATKERKKNGEKRKRYKKKR